MPRAARRRGNPRPAAPAGSRAGDPRRTPRRLVRPAQGVDVDTLRTFAGDDDACLAADLAAVVGDPVFGNEPPTRQEVVDFAATIPDVARQHVEALAERLWRDAARE